MSEQRHHATTRFSRLFPPLFSRRRDRGTTRRARHPSAAPGARARPRRSIPPRRAPAPRSSSASHSRARRSPPPRPAAGFRARRRARRRSRRGGRSSRGRRPSPSPSPRRDAPLGLPRDFGRGGPGGHGPRGPRGGVRPAGLVLDEVPMDERGFDRVLKVAYRSRARAHPDKHLPERRAAAEAEFKKVAAAHEILMRVVTASAPRRRAASPRRGSRRAATPRRGGARRRAIQTCHRLRAVVSSTASPRGSTTELGLPNEMLTEESEATMKRTAGPRGADGRFVGAVRGGV